MESIRKPLLVVCGDGVASEYQMKNPENSYVHLLSRRLGFDIEEDIAEGASTSDVLLLITNDEKIKRHIKSADIIILSIGTQNIELPILSSMRRALGIEKPANGHVSSIGEVLRENPEMIKKAVIELSSSRSALQINAGVDTFRREFNTIIERLHELNPSVKIIVQTVFNSFETANTRAFHILGRVQAKYYNAINDCILRNEARGRYLTVDLEREFKRHKSTEEFTNIRKFDSHLTDFGHAYVYKMIFSALVRRYAEYNCRENPDVFMMKNSLCR